MIINGFGGSSVGAGNASNDGWIDIINVPYSGTTTVPTFQHFSGSKTIAFASTEIVVSSWPYTGDYNALRIKPASLTLKSVSGYSGTSNYPTNYRFGFIASDTQLDSNYTASSTDYRTWMYAWLSGITTTVAAGTNLATAGSNKYYITPFETKQYTTYRQDYAENIHTPVFYDKFKMGSGYYVVGTSYYFYIYQTWVDGGSSGLSFSYSGGLVIQAHY